MAENDAQNTGGEVKEKPVDTAKLQQQRDHWMSKATDYEKRFEGIDPEKARADSEALRLLREEQAKADPKRFDEWKETVKNEEKGLWAKKVNDLESEVTSLRSERKELKVVDAVMKEAAEKFNPDALPIIRKLVREECDYDGERVVVKGEDGKPMRSKANPAQDMGIAEYVAGLAEIYPSLAKPQGSAGTKSPGVKSTPNGASGGNVSLDQYLKMTNEERAARLTPQERSRFSQQALSRK